MMAILLQRLSNGSDRAWRWRTFLLFLLISAIGWFFWASPANADAADELVAAGREAYLKGSDDLARNHWEEAEKLGIADASYYLGWLYSTGRGVPYDEIRATKLFHRAATQGHPLAALELASKLEGNPAVKNFGTAEKWYKVVVDNLPEIVSQSEAGDPFAQTSLGFLFGFGKGVKPDPKKYFLWQKAAADQGLAAGQYLLSYAFETGTGTEKNPALAVKWVQKAAAQGLVYAQDRLGEMYRDGIGIKPNTELAIHWFEKATDANYSVAERNLAELYIDLSRFEEAVPHAQRSYDIIHKIFGPDHYYAAKAQVTLANVEAYHRGQPDKARLLLLKAVATIEQLYGKKYWELLRPLRTLSNIYVKSRKFELSKAALDQAMEIARSQFGDSQREVASTLEFLGDHYEPQTKFKEAKKAYKQALRIFRTETGTDAFHIANLEVKVAGTMSATREFQGAEALFAKSIGTYQELYGKSDLKVAHAYLRFATFYRGRSRHKEAFKLYDAAEIIADKFKGKSYPTRAEISFNRAQSLAAMGDGANAEREFKRAVGLADQDLPAAVIRKTRYRIALAEFYINERRVEEAETLLLKVHEIASDNDKLDNIHVVPLFPMLSSINAIKGDLSAALGYAQEFVSFVDRMNIKAPEIVGGAYMMLSGLRLVEGNKAEAIFLIQKSVGLLERYHGPTNPEIVPSLLFWADLLFNNGDKVSAKKIAERALGIVDVNFKNLSATFIIKNFPKLSKFDFERDRLDGLFTRGQDIVLNTFSEKSPEYADFLIGRAKTLGYEEEEIQEKIEMYWSAISILEEAYGTDDPKLLEVLEKLGSIVSLVGNDYDFEHTRTLPYEEQIEVYKKFQIAAEEREREQEKILKRVRNISLSSYGQHSVQYADALYTLGHFYSTRNHGGKGDKEVRRSDMLKSLSLHMESLKILERIFSDKNGSLNKISTALWNISFLNKHLGNYREALFYSQRNYNRIKSQTNPLASQINEDNNRELKPGRFIYVTEGNDEKRKKGKSYFTHHLELLLSPNIMENRAERETEAFEALQYARTNQAARAISKMVARFTAEKSGAGEIVRELQDAFARREMLSKELGKAYSEVAGAANNAVFESYGDKLDAVNKQIVSLNDRITREFPRYDDLVSNKPTPLKDIQKLIGPTEALVTTFNNFYGIWTFVVRKKKLAVGYKARSHKSGDKSIKDNVYAVRQSIDLNKITEISDLLKFDVNAAQQLYAQTLGQVENALQGIDHLIFVPGKTLQQIPLSLFVYDRDFRKPETLTGFRDIPWLYKKFAISTLPSIASLKALRTISRRSVASRPFIGFGAPIFQTTAANSNSSQKASDPGMKTRLAVLNALSSLPATADELHSIARFLEASQGSVVLGRHASETEVKKRELKNYRILAFATHGLVAGDQYGLDEPALALTPGAEDDGILTASEISQLKLDADLVILSACNTAAGQDKDSEGLSGLAKAFLYAGSRALLVSHWPVETASAKKLTVGIFKQIRSHPNIGQAEALRRSIGSLAENDNEPHFSHPAFWAPFVLVGDGGATQ
jgi:CHAT domain-containing protein/TPR repeat protein